MSKFSNAAALCLALCAPFFFESVAHAQTFAGTILGTVLDSTGAAVPDANVSVLDTATGITLGDSFAEVKRAYPVLKQSGSFFWRTASGIVFAFDAPGNVAAASQIYEIKNNVCPAAL